MFTRAKIVAEFKASVLEKKPLKALKKMFFLFNELIFVLDSKLEPFNHFHQKLKLYIL